MALWRKRSAAVAGAIALMLTQAGPACAATGVWTDPADDAYIEPQGNIGRYSLALDENVSASLELGIFNYQSVHGSMFAVELDVNGDGVTDYTLSEAERGDLRCDPWRELRRR